MHLKILLDTVVIWLFIMSCYVAGIVLIHSVIALVNDEYLRSIVLFLCWVLSLPLCGFLLGQIKE
jgi:hypothetical protein